MKFTALLALIVAATVVSAETNAQRMARGLPPNVPGKFRRGTPVAAARRGSPSGTHSGSCHTGKLLCCIKEVITGSDQDIDNLVDELNLPVPDGIPLGINCTSVSNTDTCKHKSLCCSHNLGHVSYDCSNPNT